MKHEYVGCPDKVCLAERLITPWADVVGYARSGGETNLAIRWKQLKEVVAICGYAAGTTGI